MYILIILDIPSVVSLVSRPMNNVFRGFPVTLLLGRSVRETKGCDDTIYSMCFLSSSLVIFCFEQVSRDLYCSIHWQYSSHCGLQVYMVRF